MPEEPELYRENEAPYRAFWDLAPDRPIYLESLGHIPLPSVMAYAVMRDLPTYELFLDVRAMDEAFLRHARDRRKTEKERAEREARNKGKGPHGSRR